MVQLSGTDLAPPSDFNERCFKQVVVTWKLPFRVEESGPESGSMNVYVDDSDRCLDREVADNPRCRLQTDSRHVIGKPVTQRQWRRRRVGRFEQSNGAYDSNSALTREPIPNSTSPPGDCEGCTQRGLDELSVGSVRQQTLLPKSVECSDPDIARYAPATEQARNNLLTKILAEAKAHVFGLPTLIDPESGRADLPGFPPGEPGWPGVDASVGAGHNGDAIRRCRKRDGPPIR